MLKEEADNSEKQKEALTTSISDISHQLKTPLTSILIMLDNLSESDNMDKQTRDKFIAEISRQIENMNWLVISLLKLSRLDAGVVEFEREKINANKLVKEVISNLESYEFEMLFIKKTRNIWGYVKTIFAILFKQHNKKEYFEYYQSDKIKIVSEIGIPWTIDRRVWRKKKRGRN